MPLCLRKGCGKEFDDTSNSPESCNYHPGAPVFHEGLKGWNCCLKRVADFNDFLKIPGCSVGCHSTSKPEEPQFSSSEVQEPVSQKSDDSKTENKADSNYKMGEVLDSLPSLPIPQIISKEEKLKIKEAEEKEEISKEDDTSVEVAPGTLCKRRGCGYKFVSDDLSRNSGPESSCQFHPGAPVFHEGSKGWTCCKRKVLEFDEFLKIQGCKTAKHIFVERKQDMAVKKESVECRFDWYQSPTQVILSIFAKKIDKASTTFEFQLDKLLVDVSFQENKVFKKCFSLSQVIIPSQSKYEILSTKVEIILAKGNGVTWPSLEMTDKVSTWTTFGASVENSTSK